MKISLVEVEVIYSMTTFFGRLLTGLSMDYLSGKEESVDLPGQVVGLLFKRPGEAFLFLRLPRSTERPSFLYDRSCPIDAILNDLSSRQSPYQGVITRHSLELQINCRSLLMIRLAREHNTWARQSVQIGDFVVLFSVSSAVDQRRCARISEHRVFSLDGKKPGQRSVVLREGLFGICFAILELLIILCFSTPLENSILTVVSAEFSPLSSMSTPEEYPLLRSREETVAATVLRNASEPLFTPRDRPDTAIVPFSFDESRMKLLQIPTIDHLREHVLKNEFVTRQGTSSHHQRYFLLHNCRLFSSIAVNEEEEAAGKPILRSLMSVRRHCVLLYCCRNNCSFVSDFESVKEALKRQSTGEQEDGRRASLQCVSCPGCHIGSLRPFFWLKFNVRDNSSSQLPLSVIIGPPQSESLFDTDANELLFAAAASEKLPSSMKEVIARICSPTAAAGEEPTGPQYSIVLYPNLITKERVSSEESHLFFAAQGTLNEELFGTESETVLRLVGVYPSESTLPPSALPPSALSHSAIPHSAPSTSRQ